MAQTYTADVPDGTTNILQDNINGRNNENTLRSNFSGTAFPDTPVEGQHCYRKDTGIEYIYDGTAWIEVAATNTLGLDVAAAKGTLSNLSTRLNISINPDGTLKDPTTANVDEFKVSNVTPTYVDATTFSVPDDLTGIFTAGRLLKITDGAETKYLLVVSSAFDTVTNVVVDGTITASISAVDFGILQQQLENIPTQVNTDKSKKMASTEFVHNVFGEFYPTGLTPIYVDANNFSVTGDQTAIFTKGRVLKITDTGGTVYAVVSASVYDTVTTVTIAGDTIDSGISAVLYAVQQHTSAIWESGSNANGEYIKFVDGTMECYLNQTVTDQAISGVYGSLYTGDRSWVFPCEFSVAPVVINQSKWGASGCWSSIAGSPTTTSCRLGFVDITPRATGTSMLIVSFAIGRWY